MYKVLLVDDEMFVRKGLTQLIDWEGLGYKIVEEAENGEEARALIERLDIDLVITDIRMPVLDGLQLIEAVMSVKDKAYHPEFIIISGYHDFSYAQQAIRFGVHDYVLKPVDEEELTATLKKLSNQLGSKKLSRIQGIKPAYATLLEALIQGQVKPEDLSTLTETLGLTNQGPYTYVLVEASPNPSDQSETTVLTEKGIIEAVRQVVGQDTENLLIYEQGSDKFGLLLHKALLAGVGGQMEIFLRRLFNSLSHSLNRGITIYVGAAAQDLGSINQSYTTANEAALYKFACDGESVLFADKVLELPLYYLDMDADYFRQLVEQVEENKEESYKKTIETIFYEFRFRRFAPTAVAASISRCMIGIIRVIRNMEGDEHRLDSLKQLVNWQQKNWDLRGLKTIFLEFVAQAAVYIDTLRKEQTKGGIERIRKFIEANYTTNISLKSIASQFYMNPVYLGQLFRKTYGVYFNDFLLHLRIQEAKKLLRQTDLRMYEIADKVGFQNADYFVTQFEKLEHMTPTEYRNKLIGKK